MPSLDENLSLYCCPVCHAPLERQGKFLQCTNQDCPNPQGRNFGLAGDVPVLIDFRDSILKSEQMRAEDIPSPVPRNQNPLLRKARELVYGVNKDARRLSRAFMDALPKNRRAVVLVIGGGAIGAGMEDIYANPNIRLINLDIYRSEHTSVIADAHRLPFPPGSIDGIWCQAVLEHVLGPDRIVAEMHRVLKPEGLVFCDSPFMQQVHEGAYDFFRFSLSGHRWLFRQFDEVEAGLSAGAGMTLVWAIRYFFQALLRSKMAGFLAAVPFFWLRLLDPILDRRYSADGANAVYFFGRKASQQTLQARDMPSYYR